jgi:hypothetical protein
MQATIGANREPKSSRFTFRCACPARCKALSRRSGALDSAAWVSAMSRRVISPTDRIHQTLVWAACLRRRDDLTPQVIVIMARLLALGAPLDRDCEKSS